MQTYTPQPVEPAKVAESMRARTLADAGLGEVPAWGLPELTKASMRLNPELDTARAQWRAAQAAEITAGQRPNPSLSTSGEHHSRANAVSPWTWSLSIEIPVETHGKRETRIEQATALSEAARYDIGQTAWNIRSQLRTRLLDAYAIDQRIAQLKKEADLRLRICDLLEARVQAGLVSGTDLADARLLLHRTLDAVSAEKARVDESIAAVAQTVGVPRAALNNVPLSFVAFASTMEELPPEDIQRAALLNRLDIRKALAVYAAAEAKLKLEIARQYPDISYAPGYSWDQGDIKWSLGLSLVLALLNKNEGPIAEARAARDVEAARFTALQATVIGQQEQAWARWQSTLVAVGNARQLVGSQKARLAQTERQFDSGYADRLELTTAQLELVIAESGVLAARLSAQYALGQLEDAVQQPLDGSEPLPEIPQQAMQEKVNE